MSNWLGAWCVDGVISFTRAGWGTWREKNQRARENRPELWLVCRVGVMSVTLVASGNMHHKYQNNIALLCHIKITSLYKIQNS